MDIMIILSTTAKMCIYVFFYKSFKKFYGCNNAALHLYQLRVLWLVMV